MTIVWIVAEVLHPDKDIVGLGHSKRNFGSEVVLLELFALGNTAHVRFMQTVNFIGCGSFLATRFKLSRNCFLRILKPRFVMLSQ